MVHLEYVLEMVSLPLTTVIGGKIQLTAHQSSKFKHLFFFKSLYALLMAVHVSLKRVGLPESDKQKPHPSMSFCVWFYNSLPVQSDYAMGCMPIFPHKPSS